MLVHILQQIGCGRISVGCCGVLRVHLQQIHGCMQRRHLQTHQRGLESCQTEARLHELSDGFQGGTSGVIGAVQDRRYLGQTGDNSGADQADLLCRREDFGATWVIFFAKLTTANKGVLILAMTFKIKM